MNKENNVQLIKDNLNHILYAINSIEEEDILEDEAKTIKDFNLHELPDGQGGSRKAYELMDNFIIKVPTAEDGELQSKLENKISKYENLNIICKTLKTNHEDIVIQEKLNMISDSSNYDLSILDYLETFNPELVDMYKDKLEYLVGKYDLLEEDLYKISSWGQNKTGNILLFDYGCDIEIYSEYYD